MTTARRKGTDFQAWVKKWLEERDWVVANLPIGGRYQPIRDVFGCDLIAKKAGRSGTLWIQVTADSKAGIKRKTEKILADEDGKAIPWDPNSDIVQLWIKRRPGIIAVYFVTAKGNTRPCGRIVNRGWCPASPFNFEY